MQLIEIYNPDTTRKFEWFKFGMYVTDANEISGYISDYPPMLYLELLCQKENSLIRRFKPYVFDEARIDLRWLKHHDNAAGNTAKHVSLQEIYEKAGKGKILMRLHTMNNIQLPIKTDIVQTSINQFNVADY